MTATFAESAPTIHRFGKWLFSDLRQKILVLLLSAEATVLLAVLVLQPGFDKGHGPLDLDFDFVVQMAWCFVVLWFIGFVSSWIYWAKKKRYLYIHLSLFPLFLFLIIAGFNYYRQ